MTSGQLERSLRETFAQQSAVPPVCVDPAGSVIRRGRRIQRRRGVLGATLVAVATVAVSALSIQFTAPGGGSTGPAFAGNPLAGPVDASPGVGAATPAAPRIEPPPVDVVVGTHLHSVSGRLIDLANVGTVVAARRSGDAFLVVTAAAGYGSTLWVVREDDAPNAVLPAVDEIVLAPDGSRVAWRDGDRMSVAPVAEGRLGTAVQSGAPAGGRLTSFLGAGVLLARGRPGGVNDGYDVWWPARGTHGAAWSESVTSVYGLLPDGRTAVGQVQVGAEKRPCLALLAADGGLAPIRTTCALQLTPAGHGAVSPDGRWLIVNGRPADSARASDPGRATVVELDEVFDGRPVVRTAEFVLADDVVWTAADTLLHVGPDGDLIRVTVSRVSGGGKIELNRVAVPGANAGARMILAASPRH